MGRFERLLRLVQTLTFMSPMTPESPFAWNILHSKLNTWTLFLVSPTLAAIKKFRLFFTAKPHKSWRTVLVQWGTVLEKLTSHFHQHPEVCSLRRFRISPTLKKQSWLSSSPKLTLKMQLPLKLSAPHPSPSAAVLQKRVNV